MPFRFGSYKSDAEIMKQARLLFSEDLDLLSDEEKEARGVHVYTNEALIASVPELSILSRNYKG